MSSNSSATSGDERIETQGLVAAVTTTRLSPPFRNGTNDTITGTITELVENCHDYHGNGTPKFQSGSIDIEPSQDRIDTAV